MRRSSFHPRTQVVIAVCTVIMATTVGVVSTILLHRPSSPYWHRSNVEIAKYIYISTPVGSDFGKVEAFADKHCVSPIWKWEAGDRSRIRCTIEERRVMILLVETIDVEWRFDEKVKLRDIVIRRERDAP